MAVPTRNSNAPYADGATIEAADIETDISNLYAELGNIEGANIATGADIDGSKFANGSVPVSKLVTLVPEIGLSKFASKSAIKTGISTATGGNLTGNSSYQNVSGITPISLTVGSVLDMILLEFFASDIEIDNTALGHVWTFSIDGTDQADLYQIDNETGSDEQREVHMLFGKVATGLSGSVQFMVREKETSGGISRYSSDVPRIFRATIIPIKS